MSAEPRPHLERHLRLLMEENGPLSLADYMAACLTHPESGYYTSTRPIGKEGDFITAPEVSQMFGELIGVWAMRIWRELDCPSPFALAEAGPGTGALMMDLLRAAKIMPDFLAAMKPYALEISPELRKQQARALENSGKELVWIEDIRELPDLPTIFIANEFLDALPFRQWIKTEQGWAERGIGFKDGRFVFCLRPTLLPQSELPQGHIEQPIGAIFETAPARQAFATHIAGALSRRRGAALFIDYGHRVGAFGDGLQAVRNHAPTDPLEEPGKADLTSPVDFAPLLAAAREAGCFVPDIITQREFLLNLGLGERTSFLAQKHPDQSDNLRQAVERLAGRDQMGDLFKVMVIDSGIAADAARPGFI